MKREILIIAMIVLMAGISLAETQNPGKGKGTANQDEYYRLDNEKFRFSMSLPRRWKADAMDLNYKYVMVLSNRDSSEIKITATAADDQETEKWETWGEWYATDLGTNLKVILEKDNVEKGNAAEGEKKKSRLLVFQYTRQNATILKRIMIHRYNGNILVIECGAPVQAFYTHEKTFNRVMKSLEFVK